MSPYVEAAARRVGIIADQVDVYRFPRTQREAGIEFKQWESRAEPVRPLWLDVFEGVTLAALITAAFIVPAIISNL